MSTLLASYNTSTIVFSSVITKEIEDFYSAEFKQCIEIYKFSFPSNETRPIEKVVEMLRNDLNYHLYISLDCQAVIGISLLYIFSSLNIGLLDYIAVIPSYYRLGVGNALFRFTLKKFNSIVKWSWTINGSPERRWGCIRRKNSKEEYNQILYELRWKNS